MSFKTKVGRSAAWAMAGQGSTALLSVVNFAVVGRFVEPREYGSFLLAMMVLTMAQWLAMNAYKEPLVQAKELSDGQINSVFTFSVMVGVLLGMAMLAAAFYFERVVGSTQVAVLIVLLAGKLLLDASLSVPWALRARQMDFSFLAWAAIVSNLIATAVNIGMLFGGFGLVSLACSQLVASALLFFALFYYGRRRYIAKITKGDLAILRGYSPHVILWQGIEAINQTVDRYLISTRLTMTDLGLYGFGKRLNDVVIEVLIGATASVSLSAFSRMQDEMERLRAAFLKAMRVVTLMVLPVIAVLYVTADQLVPLVFGDKWTGSVSVYRWFLLLGVIQTIGMLQGGLLRSLWKPGTWTRYMLAQCIANVVVLSVVAGYGIEVLAAAIVIRTYVLWGWIVLKTCRALNLQVSVYAVQLLKPVSMAIAAALCGFWVRNSLQGMNTLLSMAVSGAVVAAAFSLFVLLFMRPAIVEIFSLLRSILFKRFGAAS